jgi:hypothetical protein
VLVEVEGKMGVGQQAVVGFGCDVAEFEHQVIQLMRDLSEFQLTWMISRLIYACVH